MNKILSSVRCFLLDMDGTVYLSGEVIDGAVEAVGRMRTRARVLFLTNNTSVSRLDYVNKLNGMGFGVATDDIYTAGTATLDYLNAYHKGKSVYLLGTQNLRDEFLRADIKLCETSPDLVVIGFDTSLRYERLSGACSFIRAGVPYLLTHPDINCPVKNGGFIPDVGSFNALIELSTGKKPFIICGKPYNSIGDGVKRLTGLDGAQIAMVGDRLSTDMRFAYNNGFKSVLVLSGEAKKDDLINQDRLPDIIADSIADI